MNPPAPTVEIAGRVVGGGAPAYVIAEVAQNHDGSLGLAHAHIDAAAEAGADAVKFQTHIADAESTVDEPFRVRFSSQDETRYDYWKRMEFTEAQWHGLAEHAAERGLAFLSSAFSRAAVELLGRVGVPAWKVGSGETVSGDLLPAMAATGLPVLLSTGMSTLAEVERRVDELRAAGAPVAVFQCTSRYPADLADVGLNVLPELRALGCPVGLSDHSGTRWPAIAAIARGVDLVEVHLTFDRRLFGPDVGASLTIEELRDVVDARDAFATMDAAPVDKSTMADALAPMRELFGKSLAAGRPLAAGHVVTDDDLVLKKPGTGIPPERRADVVGRRTTGAVSDDRLLRWEDLGDA